MGRGISAGTLGIAIVAILLGLVGAYVVRTAMMKEPGLAVAPPAPLTVPLASTDLPDGRTVALGDVALMAMTRGEIKEQGYDLTLTMIDPQQIIGRTLKAPLKKGQPFTTDLFYLQGTRGDYTSKLKPGFRAISLQMPKDKGGSLPVGALVDLIFRSTEQDAKPGELPIPEVTVSLLEGVEIIDVYEPPPPAARTSRGVDLTQRGLRVTPPPTITLAVTAPQAQMVQTAVGRGEMSLVARPENERVALGGTRKAMTLEELLGIEPPKPMVVFATEIFRRGQRSVNIYRDDKLLEEMKADVPAPASDPVPVPVVPVPVVPVPVPAVPVPVPAVPAPVPAPLDPLAPPADPNPPFPAPVMP